MQKEKATSSKGNKNRSKRARSSTPLAIEKSELLKPIWAVIDREGTRLNGVTYNEAQTSVSENSGTIITSEAASRADGGILKT